MRILASAVAAAALLALAPSAAAATRPSTYTLPGDPGGSKFEGIGYDAGANALYVSETTGGELHRATLNSPTAVEWLGGDGTDGRWTARGVTVDGLGRVYVAGGPNGTQNAGAPDLWVYDRSGSLLAALRVGVENAFLNDVAIGPDGAAYFTNSNAPQIFRVAAGPSGWSVDTWADATGVIPTAPGFNLGGIVTSSDESALIVAQGNVGALWRFDLASRAATPVATGGADLTGADGLVRQGNTLWVVRNFQRMLATVTVDAAGTSAVQVAQTPTDPTRVFTTAKYAQGRLLAVDSKFDETVAAPPYEVVALDVRP